MRVLILSLTCLCLCGCQFAAFTSTAKLHSATPIDVYLVSNGWHVGVILPGQALERALPELRSYFPANAPNYEIGWGDADFYQYRDGFPPVTMIVRSLFASRGSVVHLTAYDQPVNFSRGEPPDVVKISLSEQSFRDLGQFLSASFAKNPNGSFRYLGEGLQGERSAFFASQLPYRWNFTCNTWVAHMLQHAGYKIDPRTKLSAQSVIDGFPKCPPLP